MKLTEEQIQDVITLRDDLVEQIDKHQKTIEMLEKNLAILNVVLKETSFTKASAINKIKKIDLPTQETTSLPNSPQKNLVPITRGSDGKIIANAYVSPDQLSIILEESVGLSADTPPFKSFFIDRIIGEMKRRDSEDAEIGKIQKESVIDYIIKKNGSEIREIIIKNYRQKERINEIINTAGWSLTRMLENLKK